MTTTSSPVPFLLVFGILSLLSLIASSGIFDNLAIESGFERYAETPYRLPVFHYEVMPFNTAVNLIYVIVGLNWLKTSYHISLGKKPERLSSNTAAFLQGFSTLLVAYGGIQFMRIVTQAHYFAVLDQWATLPFFSWLTSWCLYAQHKHIGVSTIILLNSLSVFSYLLTLVMNRGFEVALGVHILYTVHQSFSIQRLYGSKASLCTFFQACLCCTGFVFLKLFDKELASWKVFTVLTGHFWSKLCDVLQFHYACVFVSQIAAQVDR